MKILLVSTTALRTPPANYGGLERVVYEHAAGLAALGHEVTMVGSKGSKAPARVTLIETVEPWEKLDETQQKAYAKADKVWNGWRAHEEEAYAFYKDKLTEFDVVGDASWSKWSLMSKKEEIVGTCHSMKPYNSKPPREFPLLCGVSRGHSRALSAQMGFVHRTVWNPVDVDSIPMQKDKSDRILSLNRIMPTKGIHYFIDVAEKTKAKADVAGDDGLLVPDQGYVNMIKQRCAKSANVVYHGLVTDTDRVKLLQNAKVLLCFKDGGYEEVFGLQAVEALAAGTPVVAAKSWGFEDTIEDGKTGFLVNTVDEAVAAVTKILDGTTVIKPEDCRAAAERFSRANVSKQYEALLKSVVAGCRW